MSGLGYKGSRDPKVYDAEIVSVNPPKPSPAPKSTGKRPLGKNATLIKTLRNKKLNQMQAAIALETTEDLMEKESEKAQLAGQLVAGMVTPNEGGRLTPVTAHPDLKKIETELILSRGADLAGMCQRWGIFDSSGGLAVAALTRHYGHMRRRSHRLFDTLDKITIDKMATSYMDKVDEIYNLSRQAHVKAMSAQRMTDYGPLDDPNFGAAEGMLDQMRGAAALLGAAMERQDKKEALSSNPPMPTGGMNIFNAPGSKMQVLGLPKAIPQKQLPPAE